MGSNADLLQGTLDSDSENFGGWGDAWLGNCATHSASLERRASGWTGVAVSSPAQAGVQGLDSGGMGPLAKQSAGKVLLAYSQGKKAVGNGTRSVGPDGGG